MSSGRSIRRVAVLDIGKTNAKVVVLDAETGTEIVARRTANRVLSDGPYPHYDVDHLWSFALEALGSLAATPGFDAISVTTHGASAALLAADGSLALPVIDYEHVYPKEVCEAYDQLRPPFIETFSPRLPGGLNVGAQIHYQKTRFPDDFARVRTVMTYPQYWAFRLTGVAANEMTSLGCHTDLWRPSQGDYSSLVDRLGVRALMAPIRSAFDVLGPVLPDIAGRIGLKTPLPVYCGIHDSNASLLPHLVRNAEPFAVVSTGTWVVSFAVGGRVEQFDPKRDTLVNVDAYGRAVPSSRFMGGREFEMIAREIGAVDEGRAEAALRDVLSGGMMLLPSVVEGSGPFPQRQARWIVGKDATPAKRHAAASLYLALMTDTCLNLIRADGPIFVEGPFAFNGTFLQALSSLTARTVVALPGSTGTSQGAALLTGIKPPEAAAERRFDGEIEGLAEYRQRWHGAINDGSPTAAQ
jgi:sugar (pentulose or hexulose) kinase